MSHTSRFICFLYTVLLINLISEINGQKVERVGPARNRGDTGAKGVKGEKGEKGERGDIGPYGKIKLDSSDVDAESLDKFYEPREPSERGSNAADAATSCRDKKLDLSKFEPENNTVSVYIYDANPFEVNCDNNEKAKTCLLQKKPMEFDDKGYKFPEAGKPFWLSTVGFDLLGFYKNSQIKHISQLKYLLRISYKVSIEIVVHCNNTVISKDSEKYLQIHLWDGQNVGPYPTLMSPAHYEIPDELNKCKDFTDETWGTATIKLTTSSNFIKDFYIRDIQKEKNQAIYIELKELCFYN